MKKNSAKKHGEIYTPSNIVKLILDSTWYIGSNRGILEVHVMDNSCGKGAFLSEVVRRYVKAFALYVHGTTDELTARLEFYIHGIEIKPDICAECIETLNKTLSDMGLGIRPSWDIKCGNALEMHDYDGKMDLVVGNPPYVRVHNVKGDDEMYRILKNYEFCKTGSTDLYIAFYELGFRMLKNGGTLCYISPSGWLKGPAGRAFRNYVRETQSLAAVLDYGQKKVFDGVTVYTGIFKFNKEHNFRQVFYESEEKKDRWYDYENIFIGDEIYFGDKSEIEVLRNVLEFDGEKSVRVKNGLATLLDDFFIYDGSKPGNEFFEIPIIKASTGEEKTLFYPYSSLGGAFPLDSMQKIAQKAYDYIMENEERLKKRDFDGDWYAIGRKQGLSDIEKRKIAVNNLVRNHNDLKINYSDPFSAVYSGLYILFSDERDRERDVIKKYEAVTSALRSEDFDNYVSALKKYKSGGYYTFTARQLEKYLNWKLAK